MGLLTSFTDTDVRRRVRLPKWRAVRYHDVRSFATGAAVGVAVTANTIYAAPLWVPAAVTVDRIGINVTVAGAGATIARLMLHAAGADDMPGTLLLDAGTVAVDTTGDKIITISHALPPGLVWATVVSSGAPTILMVGSALQVAGSLTPGSATGEAPNRALGGTTAPDPFGTPDGFTNVYPIVALRAA